MRYSEEKTIELDKGYDKEMKERMKRAKAHVKKKTLKKALDTLIGTDGKETRIQG